MGLVFSIFNFFTEKTHHANNRSAKKIPSCVHLPLVKCCQRAPWLTQLSRVMSIFAISFRKHTITLYSPRNNIRTIRKKISKLASWVLATHSLLSLIIPWNSTTLTRLPTLELKLLRAEKKRSKNKSLRREKIRIWRKKCSFVAQQISLFLFSLL